ncbi:MAG: efflux RND transporter periplasmic adaptor subunit [Planctomycetaceae bacterium]|nr:efflux RND transporter periplasmic adaptor subunit [Planctomycetaceae bacterium]
MPERPGLEQVRDRVLRAAQDVERLCHSHLPPQKLFPQFLQLVGSAVGAAAGAVWFPDESGRPFKVLDQGTDAFGLEADPALKTWRQQLLANVLATGEITIERMRPSEPRAGAPPQSNGNGKESSVPTVIVSPLHRDRKCVGAVEFVFRGELRSEAQVSTLQFVEQMCGFASKSLTAGETSAGVAWPKFLEAFEGLSLRIHRCLDYETIGALTTNDGRALLGCQRVSLAVQTGRRLKVCSISGQEGVNRRSRLVTAMTALMNQVVAGREPVYVGGQAESLPAPLIEPLTRYLEENGSQIVAVIPLLDHPAPAPLDDQSSGKLRAPPSRHVVGCLMVDGPVEGAPSARGRDAIALLADHAAAALANSLTYRRIFLLPLWRFLGNGWERLRGRTMLVAGVVAAALIAMVAAMLLVPWDYRISADGRLMPVEQRQVFAPWDGEVIETSVRDGQRVKAGDVLLTLHGSELKMQILTTRNELHQKQESILALQAQIDEATKKADRDEETRLQGQLGAARVEVSGLEKQLKTWEERQRQLVVRSPIDGIVATFRVEQLLLNRPVRRGEVLMEVMQDEGKWRLEIDIPEPRMGHLLRARRDLGPERPVEFVLAAAPESTFFGTLDQVGSRAAATDSEGSVVEGHVRVEAGLLPLRSIGTEVRARIDCGRRSLGYVLFGDFIEWVRRTLWL